MMIKYQTIDNYCWYEKFFLFPRKCALTNKTIFLKKGMVGVRMICGPGEPVYLHRYLDKKQFLLEKIKGTIYG